ncbi:hypothetical protein [Chryseobacterium sp. CH1]|uniref:hypothetical protein n=1 Tax=Chryseobacterium sp. CH1 TaxID=713551 RepID=UPI0013E92F78|nr:hypothetical protein [Chryseobacterium sp. CH1]
MTVVAYKVDGQIFWSWHVWVTDDPMGLIKSKENYTLDIIGSGETAKIKVPDKQK